MQTLRARSIPSLRALLVAMVLVAIGTLPARASEHLPVDAPGVQPVGREYISNAPWELIDTATGNLILQFTDLVLPGNAGHDLRFQRTYNLKTGRWTFGLAGVAMQVTDTWPPGQYQYCGAYTLPILLRADGLQTETIGYCGYQSVHTDQFWVYDRAARQLRFPDGSIAEYSGWYSSLSSYRDAFGNQVTLTGWGTNTLTVTQALGNGEQRVVRCNSWPIALNHGASTTAIPAAPIFRRPWPTPAGRGPTIGTRPHNGDTLALHYDGSACAITKFKNSWFDPAEVKAERYRRIEIVLLRKP